LSVCIVIWIDYFVLYMCINFDWNQIVVLYIVLIVLLDPWILMYSVFQLTWQKQQNATNTVCPYTLRVPGINRTTYYTIYPLKQIYIHVHY